HLDDIRRHRDRLLGPAHQPDHADGGADRPPQLRQPVEPDEQIAWEQRPRHQRTPARMPYPAAIARQIDAVALALQMVERLVFGVRLRVGGIPGDHAVVSLASRSNRGVMCSNCGAKIWSAAMPCRDISMTMASKLACGARVSVMTIASSTSSPSASAAARSRTTGRPAQLRPAPG